MGSNRKRNLLIIDAQILQTRAFDRGMGKYTESLLKACSGLEKKYEKLTLLLNLNLRSDAAHIEKIKNHTGISDAVVLDIPTNISKETARKYAKAEEVLSEFITRQTHSYKVDFLVTSPFFVDFPAAFPKENNVGKYAIVYDFTPYKIWHLLKIFPDDIYAQHFKVLMEADHLFTISHAVRNDLIDMFCFDEDTVTSINGGPFEQKRDEKDEGVVLKKPYIIYPSAPIVHKNNERAIQGFKLFNEQNDNQYTLYITSTFDEETQNSLVGDSKEVVFTGNLTDSQLARAYADSDAVFFPSLAEGLGMPVLEGALYNVPVACSDIRVLKELSDNGFYFFNPRDISGMAKSLNSAVKRESWSEKQRAYKKLVKDYTWQNSASILASKIGFKKQSRQYDVAIYAPDPARDSPASRLCEMIYSRSHDFRGGCVIKSKDGRPQLPSFARYLASGVDEVDSRLEIVDNRKLPFSKNKSIVLKYTPASGQKRSLKLNANKFIYDDALQLEGWQYSDDSGAQLTGLQTYEKIIELINEKIND